MRDNFKNCLDVTLAHEGGYVNDPNDPGGETKFGISKRAHPKVDIGNLTVAQAGEIYRRSYWSPIRGDDLPAGLDLVAFDGAVNSGIMRGAKWLQHALNVTPDGKIGPSTISAAKTMSHAARREVIHQACAERLQFLQGLKTWPRYKNGWTRRVNDIEARALEMVADAPKRETTKGKPVAAVGLVALILTAIASFFEEIKAAITSLFGG